VTPSRWIAALVCAIASLAVVLAHAGARDGSRPSAPPGAVRALWVWKSDAVLDGGARVLVETATAAGITDIYLYLRAGAYEAREDQIERVLTMLARHGIRVWGMEGWRGYFSDVEGPGGLLAAADALVAFNARSSTAFAGFHSDLEPHDGQDVGQARFHNGRAQSRLTAPQRADRDALLAEWLDIHETLAGKMQAAGLAYGGSLPDWVDDYFGEPVTLDVQGRREPLLARLMPLFSHYVIMSYNTDPGQVLTRVSGEMAYARSLNVPPGVIVGVETHAGAGVRVSYADTPPKDHKQAVLADLAWLEDKLSALYPGAYRGWAIHDYEGWRNLREGPPHLLLRKH
jgi:hypothetical protein